MAILSKAHKQGNFESQNSVKLSFINVRGSHSNFVGCKFFLKSNSPNILALHETNLEDSIDFSNFSVRSYLPLIRKYSLTNMYGLVVYVKDRLPVCMGLICRKLWGFFFKFLINFTSISVLPLFLYQSSFSSLCKVFYAISCNTDKVLSINPSADVFVFGDSAILHMGRLTYSGETVRPAELCYKLKIFIERSRKF